MDKNCTKKDGGDEEFCIHASRAADYAVKKVFAILGVDVDKPESVEEFRADLRFGKKMRKASDHGYFVLVASFATGIAVAVYHGVVTLFKNS